MRKKRINSNTTNLQGAKRLLSSFSDIDPELLKDTEQFLIEREETSCSKRAENPKNFFSFLPSHGSFYKVSITVCLLLLLPVLIVPIFQMNFSSNSKFEFEDSISSEFPSVEKNTATNNQQESSTSSNVSASVQEEDVTLVQEEDIAPVHEESATVQEESAPIQEDSVTTQEKRFPTSFSSIDTDIIAFSSSNASYQKATTTELEALGFSEPLTKNDCMTPLTPITYQESSNTASDHPYTSSIRELDGVSLYTTKLYPNDASILIAKSNETYCLFIDNTKFKKEYTTIP